MTTSSSWELGSRESVLINQDCRFHHLHNKKLHFTIHNFISMSTENLRKQPAPFWHKHKHYGRDWLVVFVPSGPSDASTAWLVGCASILVRLTPCKRIRRAWLSTRDFSLFPWSLAGVVPAHAGGRNHSGACSSWEPNNSPAGPSWQNMRNQTDPPRMCPAWLLGAWSARASWLRSEVNPSPPIWMETIMLMLLKGQGWGECQEQCEEKHRDEQLSMTCCSETVYSFDLSETIIGTLLRA